MAYPSGNWLKKSSPSLKPSGRGRRNMIQIWRIRTGINRDGEKSDAWRNKREGFLRSFFQDDEQSGSDRFYAHLPSNPTKIAVYEYYDSFASDNSTNKHHCGRSPDVSGPCHRRLGVRHENGDLLPVPPSRALQGK